MSIYESFFAHAARIKHQNPRSRQQDFKKRLLASTLLRGRRVTSFPMYEQRGHYLIQHSLTTTSQSAVLDGKFFKKHNEKVLEENQKFIESHFTG